MRCETIKYFKSHLHLEPCRCPSQSVSIIRLKTQVWFLLDRLGSRPPSWPRCHSHLRTDGYSRYGRDAWQLSLLSFVSVRLWAKKRMQGRYAFDHGRKKSKMPRFDRVSSRTPIERKRVLSQLGCFGPPFLFRSNRFCNWYRFLNV